MAIMSASVSPRKGADDALDASATSSVVTTNSPHARVDVASASAHASAQRASEMRANDVPRGIVDRTEPSAEAEL